MHKTPLPIILTATGYGGSGSSAGTNILEEFSSVTSFGNKFECTFIHEVDGIYDLENAINEGHRLKIDLAVKRFLSLAKILNEDADYQKCFNGQFYKQAEKYINSITTCKWNGWWHRAFEAKKITFPDKQRIRFAETLFNVLYKKKQFNSYEPDGWVPSYNPVTDYYYVGKQCDFYEKTKVYTSALFSNDLYKNKYVLVDQLLPPYNIGRYSGYFNDIKTLVIDKDPRDLYAVQMAEWGIGYIPCNNVDIFINWYKATRAQRYRINTEWKNTALFIPFESLIYEYEDSLEKIKEFIGFKTDEHIYKKQFFIPEKSIINTQVYKRYPQLKNDIEKIEKELEEYCFHFEKYPTIQIDIVNDNYIFMTDIYKDAEELQLTGKLPENSRVNPIMLIFNVCKFPFYIKSFGDRKTLKSKLKGIVKIGLFSVLFPIEFCVNVVLFLFATKEA
ncbi:hypothetical protein [Treponema denticola]|uniref:Sulfotransferase domain-containing protein n=1 Tax=Treponema denticola SP33 TaxID=999437 RepID=M2AFB1_TREDN|nr:hypothetical protein [Treponema denticola]EMB21841.1 hypothetical protein HMPREF9733_02178 [Treponema denticola SP33]EPF36038.1 hypothetical protein HMPREF9732_02272 [Treponema denticola SP32]